MPADFDALITMTAMLDVDGCIVEANAAFENAVGLSRRRIRGRHFPQFFEASDALQRVMAKTAEPHRHATLRFDATLLCLFSESEIAVQVNLLWQDGPKLWLAELWPLAEHAGVTSDERFQEQGELNRQLLRNLAHEVKNPLGGIRGAAQLLELEIGNNRLGEYTRVIIREADRLQRLVDRMLEPHRHPQKLEVVNIHEICEYVRSLVLMEHPKGLTIRQEYDISLPDLTGDRSQLTQALLNIVQNAAHALAARIASGSAVIELRTRATWRVTIGRQVHRLAMQVHVIDNGPGVPDELRDIIFFPLMTGRDGGTGLGLPLAHTYIQRHGGMVELHSAPGHTDFTITLPLQ